MDLNLRDKVAVITGGTVGIGLAVAEGLAEEGANLVLVGRNKERGDDEAARVADKFGVIATAIAADVATAEGCDAVIKGVARAFGGADILINNAGTGSNETIAEADDAKWQYYWDLHVMAAVRLARGLVPGMTIRGGGVILHNASICAVQPLWYEPIYNTTKAALMMFSKTLANEVVGSNIRVNTVNPGLVLTPDWIKTAKQIAGEDGWQAHLQGVADEAGGMKRFATPAELANFFVFMCSDKASYSTGSTYFVDGGWLKTV
ncbi:short-chain dehydrogenase [Devosia epidermidihirudinis]|uniref:Short-chain dehydrogenase n=1 Tax=Devosia epidermidihirudinis TaxID=1293439 RepID=A0A0F5Q8U9_9HYPH|nr:SDR family oxidoreductase [Devosia epidermidihirudinis]KKC37432.1 short-chain dehydrogenase [Devosia epidermidihirudinis]